mgnify:CR=1 FL=1
MAQVRARNRERKALREDLATLLARLSDKLDAHGTGLADAASSPRLAAEPIIPALLEKGARIKAHDPQGMEEARKYLPQGIEYAQDAYETCTDADAVVLMTEWNQYRALDLDRLMEEMQGRVFIDLRNVYEPQKMKDKGFIYAGVGRS